MTKHIQQSTQNTARFTQMDLKWIATYSNDHNALMYLPIGQKLIYVLQVKINVHFPTDFH